MTITYAPPPRSGAAAGDGAVTIGFGAIAGVDAVTVVEDGSVARDGVGMTSIPVGVNGIKRDRTRDECKQEK